MLFRDPELANNWYCYGQYEVAWRGRTNQDELVGYLTGNPDRARQWMDILKTRATKGEAGYDVLEDAGFEGVSSNPDAMDLARQANEDGDLRLDFMVMHCVGFDGAGLTTWVDNRNSWR